MFQMFHPLQPASLKDFKGILNLDFLTTTDLVNICLKYLFIYNNNN